jgi:hypothetical protein
LGCSPSPCTASPDNSAATTTPNPTDSYFNAYGTLNLGALIGTGYNPGCFVGNEMVGKITPHDYKGMITLHRQVINGASYTNIGQTLSFFNMDDTSLATLRDDDPQSPGPTPNSPKSNGKVYDLDGPGKRTPPVDGNVYRLRVNFYADAALPNGTTISPFFMYDVRVSCQGYTSGPQFAQDVPGDNQIVLGFTPITWNLN